MGRKNIHGRKRYLPHESDLTIEFNPQPVEVIRDMIYQIADIDPIEFLYTVLVLGTLSILFLPSLIFIIAAL